MRILYELQVLYLYNSISGLICSLGVLLSITIAITFLKVILSVADTKNGYLNDIQEQMLFDFPGSWVKAGSFLNADLLRTGSVSCDSIFSSKIIDCWGLPRQRKIQNFL